MKKSILVVAVSAALAAGSAQAAIEMYGKLHMSLDQLNNGNIYDGNTNAKEANAGTQAKSLYVSSNQTTFGFKASEDLEGGLKAIAVLDFTVEADNPDSKAPLSEREAYVGLGGGFGTMRIGKLESPTKLLGRRADFFGDQVGDSRNLTARASGLGLVTNAPQHNTTGYPTYTYNTTQRLSWEVRGTNALGYTSPTMGGFTFAFLYNPDEGRKDSRIIDMTLTLAGPAGPGKMAAGLGWASHGKAWNNDEVASTNLRFAGSYEIKSVKMGLFYQKASNMNTVPATPLVPAVTGGAAAIPAVIAASLDRTTWGLGGSYKIGAGAVKAQYYKAGESQGAATDPADGATMIALGYDHNLSKTTRVYVAYAMTKNDQGTAKNATTGIPTAGGTYSASAAGHSSNNTVAGQNVNTIDRGSDPKALSVGMVFTF